MSDPILANLTASDKLLLSQAIYQIGTNKDDKDAIFIETAAQLDQHALISLEKKKFFTPQVSFELERRGEARENLNHGTAGC